ncbi:MAG: hypothetical protein QM676_09125 [Novosphingobium sp.]
MADTRKLTNWIRGLVSALLLFVVAAHAVAPVAPDRGQGRGSAFSASTAEVSLKSGTRLEVAREIVRIDPLGPAAMPSVAALLSPAPGIPVARDGALVAHWLLAESRLRPVDPRAPPTA